LECETAFSCGRAVVYDLTSRLEWTHLRPAVWTWLEPSNSQNQN